MNLSKRPRRNRRTSALRGLCRETELNPDALILPLFAVSGEKRSEAVESMPGVTRDSVDVLTRRVASSPVKAVLLFGVPEKSEKDATGSAALGEDALVPRAVRAIKEARPEIAVLTDVCLCSYTRHGHCGALTASGEVDNDRTLDLLARMALAHARAGADIVAPSAMADGQVAAIRESLDANGAQAVAIMSYAAKFASAFYGPFRDAADSAPESGDRRGYQLPSSNRREALLDALLDEAEGADWLMVKPALPYLDVLRDLREETRLPLAAYQVSGEYAMLKSASAAGALDERSAVLESLLSIRRAGASAIITYYAEEAIKWIGR
jgi:porphobilinogen synthase